MFIILIGITFWSFSCKSFKFSFFFLLFLSSRAHFFFFSSKASFFFLSFSSSILRFSSLVKTRADVFASFLWSFVFGVSFKKLERVVTEVSWQTWDPWHFSTSGLEISGEHETDKGKTSPTCDKGCGVPWGWYLSTHLLYCTSVSKL